MSGLSDYVSQFQLGWLTGQYNFPSTNAVYLALMTAVDTDGGTGGTEVSGGGYTRVQVSGIVGTAAAWTTSQSTITLAASAPTWVIAGCTVWDSNHLVGVISAVSGTTLTLTGNALVASTGSSDSIQISAFSQATGSGPSTITNGAVITFPQSTASWGTVIAFELRDAPTGGNLLAWDYLGNFSWLPTTITNASPAVFTSHGSGYANGDQIVFSTEYGGGAPGGTFTGLLTVADVSGDTFDVGVASTSAGTGMVRKIIPQPIAVNVTASFAASAFNIASA